VTPAGAGGAFQRPVAGDARIVQLALNLGGETVSFSLTLLKQMWYKIGNFI
jgi:hypothetical protein